MTGWTLAIGIFVAGGCLSLYLALRAVGSVLADIDRRDGEGELLLTKDMAIRDACVTTGDMYCSHDHECDVP